MKRDSLHLVITGPESSGKTSLWNQLKDTFNAEFVSEKAREYLNENGLDYKQIDIQKIAYLQFQAQLEAVQKSKLCISDTCLLTLVIWQEEKYGFVDEFTLEWFHLQKVDHYFLMYPDIPWVPDPQRENETDRERLFIIYKSWLEKLDLPYTVVKGDRKLSFQKTIRQINSLKRKHAN